MARMQKTKAAMYTSGSNALKYKEQPLKRDKRENKAHLRLAPLPEKKPKSHKLGMFLLYLFLISVIVIILKAEFTVKHSSVKADELNRTLAEIKTKNEILINKINSETDFMEIKDIAMNKYGMVYPEQDDVLSIRLSNKDYTVVYDDLKSEEQKFSRIVGISGFISKGW